MTEKFLKYIKIFLPNSETKRRLYENFFSLSLLKSMTYLFPLITLPYLVRVLGPEKFGLVAFAQAFAGYFNIITDYGFNLSATRSISIHRNNPKKISEIFFSVIILKLILFLISSVVFLIIVYSLSRFSSDKSVFFFSYLLVFGNILFPIWFFQGMEKMKYITLFSLLSKIFFLVCVFIFIKNQNQYAIVPLFNSLGYLISGLIAIYLIFKNNKIYINFPSKKTIINQAKNGWHFFVSTFFINLYTSSNVFVLGLLTNNETVGIFSGGEKIVSAFRGLLTPVSQTIYPFLNRLYKDSKKTTIKALKTLGLMIGSISLVISLLLLIFAPIVVKIILGQQFENSINVVRIMSLLPFIIALSDIFAVQGLFVFGEAKGVSKIVIIASLLHIPLFILLTTLFSVNGASISIVLTEILVTILSFLKFKDYFFNYQKLSQKYEN